jgi:predicted RNA-binding Zn-ribbon protein involved in translation (DUF1610 family)
MAVTCPHCGQQTELNAVAEEPAPAAPKPTPVATAKPVAKPLTEAQKAAMAAARAATPVARPTGAKPGAKAADKKSVVVKAQWTDTEDGQPASKPLRCDFCGTKIPAGAAACPDCGTAVVAKSAGPTKPNWFRRIGVGIMLVLALVAAARWGQFYLERRPITGKDGKPVKFGVEVLNHSLQSQPGTSLLYIRGNVTNHSDIPFFSLKVEAELLDKAGNSLGKASDTKMVLDPHKLFPFNVALLDPDAKSYTNLTVSAQR